MLWQGKRGLFAYAKKQKTAFSLSPFDLVQQGAKGQVKSAGSDIHHPPSSQGRPGNCPHMCLSAWEQACAVQSMPAAACYLPH